MVASPPPTDATLRLIANLPKGFECFLQDDDGNTLVSWTVVNRL